MEIIASDPAMKVLVQAHPVIGWQESTRGHADTQCTGMFTKKHTMRNDAQQFVECMHLASVGGQ